MFCRFGGFGFSPWMSVMMGIRMLVFVGLIVLGIRFVRNYTANSSSAIKILDERFAKGEISEEEYIRRRAVVMQKK